MTIHQACGPHMSVSHLSHLHPNNQSFLGLGIGVGLRLERRQAEVKVSVGVQSE